MAAKISGTKMLVDFSPLVIFLVANALGGLKTATATLMVTTPIAVLAGYLMEKRWAIMPLVGAGFVLLFGSLTLVLDETFIKMKVTILYTCFALALTVGTLTGRKPLKTMMNGMLDLDEEGWRVLTWRYAGFFVFLALLNEAVWRTQSANMWVNFKVFGVTSLLVLFSFLQAPVVARHNLENIADTSSSAQEKTN